MKKEIRQLDSNTASLIAAGEVVEGPASIARELIDNAVDAGASSVSLELERGGIDLLRVKDDGVGMSRADLEICWKKHTTSKIRSIDDLSRIRSLGFRGEALSSIAAVSRSRIISTYEGASHELVVSDGSMISLSAAAQGKGTTVEVRSLFHKLPARKRFLRHPSAESSNARLALQEAALPFPRLEFRLLTQNTLKLFYAPSSAIERVAQIFDVSPTILRQTSRRKEKFSIDLVYSLPDFSRADRKKMWIYVNNRRIRDYRLVQAIEYAYREVLHGGLFPYVALFLSVDPDIIDFNIHPAKKEVRIQRMQEIHHEVVTLLTSCLLQGAQSSPQALQYSLPSAVSLTRVAEKRPALKVPQPKKIPRTAIQTEEAPQPFVYLGQAYKTYLLCLYRGELYAIDQHAAHERKIYDRLKENPSIQKLLVPVDILSSEEESRAIASQQEEYKKLGIELVQQAPNKWSIMSVPAYVASMGDEVAAAIRELSTQSSQIYEAFVDRIACRNAIKAGDTVSHSSAVALISFVFSLENPRCPHGRPLSIHLSRDEFDRRIGRVAH